MFPPLCSLLGEIQYSPTPDNNVYCLIANLVIHITYIYSFIWFLQDSKSTLVAKRRDNGGLSRTIFIQPRDSDCNCNGNDSRTEISWVGKLSALWRTKKDTLDSKQYNSENKLLDSKWRYYWNINWSGVLLFSNWNIEIQ